MKNNVTDRELKLLGIALYKCEGTKIRRDKRKKNTYHYAIEMTNTDPGIIKLFLLFLRKILKINEKKLRVQLFIYDDLKKEKIEQFWSRTTGIPKAQFNKTILFKQKNENYKPNPRGACKIRYHDKKKCLKLQTMINEFFGNI